MGPYGNTLEEEKAKINTYKNPDSRCKYPFICEPLGYCWSYAHHVDGTEGYDDMSKICPLCEFWSEQSSKPRTTSQVLKEMTQECSGI